MNSMFFRRALSHEINGTQLMGYVDTTYNELVARFGEPTPGCDKIQALWSIRFRDGTLATIYDWKEYIPPQNVTNWHIGGRELRAVDLVKEALR